MAPKWTTHHLSELANNEELVLVLSRPGKPVLRVPVWMAVVEGNAYVRSYLGPTSGWYRRVMAERNQAIELGPDVPVYFESVEDADAVNGAISAEYVRKYATDDYRDSVVTDLAIGTTLRILPR